MQSFELVWFKTYQQNIQTSYPGMEPAVALPQTGS